MSLDTTDLYDVSGLNAASASRRSPGFDVHGPVGVPYVRTHRRPAVGRLPGWTFEQLDEGRLRHGRAGSQGPNRQPKTTIAIHDGEAAAPETSSTHSDGGCRGADPKDLDEGLEAAKTYTAHWL